MRFNGAVARQDYAFAVFALSHIDVVMAKHLKYGRTGNSPGTAVILHDFMQAK